MGNGCSGTEVGVCGGERWKYDTTYLAGTAMVSPATKRAISDACDFSAASASKACNAAIDTMHTEVGHVNLYDVYGECIRGADGEAGGEASTHKVPWAPTAGGPDACINSIAGSAYFNQPSVIAAAHVVKQSFKWSTCGNQIK